MPDHPPSPATVAKTASRAMLALAIVTAFLVSWALYTARVPPLDRHHAQALLVTNLAGTYLLLFMALRYKDLHLPSNDEDPGGDW